jgi:lipopolysaccharide/colanic/teichoic acid biosynthesis glycosyltransferase
MGRDRIQTNKGINPMSRRRRFHLRQETDGIHPAEEFKSILDRERRRSDRSGARFSVLIFRLGRTGSEPGHDEFVRCLKGRIRTTDELGWIESQSLGILMPDTPEEGAGKLGQDIRQMLSSRNGLGGFEIYSYPQHESGDFSESGGNSAERKDGDPPGAIEDPSRNVEEILQVGLPLWKRSMDLVLAFLLLLMLFPVFLMTGILIKLLSPGPVLFKQKRVGYLGRPFVVWKFRTMKMDAENEVHRKHLNNLIHGEIPMTKLDDVKDNRIIPFGRWLRSTGIDELPQLMNVIRGEMSLIGPRPCIPYEVSEYDPWQKVRCRAVPGLTGLWQVSGKNKTTHKEMIRLDIAYCRNQSLWMDLKILLKTPTAIFRQAVGHPKTTKKKEKGYATGNY